MDNEEDFDLALTGQFGNFGSIGETVHAADAVDFEDEDELADEEEPEETLAKVEEEDENEDNNNGDNDLLAELQQEGMDGVQDDDGTLQNLFGLPAGGDTGLPDLDFASSGMQVGESDIDLSDGESAEIDQKKLQERLEREKKNKDKLMKIFYPSFKKGQRMQLQRLFPVLPLEYSYQIPASIQKPLIPKTLLFEVEQDTRKEFRMGGNKHHRRKETTRSLPSPSKQIIEIRDDDIIKEEPVKEILKTKDSLENYDKQIILSTADWNDDIILGDVSETEIEKPPFKKIKLETFDYDDWVDNDEVIFEGSIDVDFLNLKLDMNDTRLVMMDMEKPSMENKLDKTIKLHVRNTAKIPLNGKALETRFQISNDDEYEFLKDNYHTKVRATIGNMNIDHAPPAARLQFPFYKVKPPKKDIRLYHRPRFNVRAGTIMTFSPLKRRKKKKDRTKDINELFQNSSGLTLGDTGNIFVFEYAEEFPISMSKFGMGSKIINYYRKIHDDDSNRPKFPIGETHVLGVQDRSPFWNFGIVEPGHVVQALYNQMIRAPLFHQESYSTDFLLIRSQGGNSGPKYYLRSINNLFTIGQSYPAQEVPGPHSRKVTTINKNRLKMIVFRAINNNPKNRIVVKDISTHFPDQTDMQNRQKLKEFMEYQRHGDDQGHWKVKSSDPQLDYEQIRKMVTPDDICLLEMMLTGQQRFDDLESFRRERLEDLDENKRDKENEEDMAHKLAPWNTTKNFIQATQGKAMLQIHGEGDPSMKGEGFSFLKTSMKGGFLKNVENGTPLSPTPTNNKKGSQVQHSYNVAHQQKLYDEEIKKVWYKQRKSLAKTGSSQPRNVTDDDLRDDRYIRKADRLVNEEVNEKPRFLKIVRLVKNEYGIKERKITIVKDPKVVELYVKRKQQLLVEGLGNNDQEIVLTNDQEENMKVKKRLEEELAKLQRQQEKKKKRQAGITSANIDSEGRLSGKGIGKGKSTLRKCATCGAVGHIRTNKTCPMYYTVHNKSNPNFSGKETDKIIPS
ncbi:histone acetyltransferase [Martiniozyma asiatica (nom. inval.)]|nr:histone acetyltransferase [Martiniozyma asiatica]